ncbi:hypothetical protein [Streptomyces sp. NPDC000877]|uniref:hypothetical protein n=1 Tax=unclassified Streptomyces TaxID=2593676 RepID=UPI0033303932
MDQTMLADAARLLQNVPHGQAFAAYLVDTGFDSVLTAQLEARLRAVPVTNAERLADLSALCDALLLYDKLYVLRCETPPDAEDLQLRNALIDLGIVEEIDVAEHGPAIASELVLFLAATDGEAVSSLLEDIAAVVRGSLAEEDGAGVYSRTTSMIDAFRDGMEGRDFGRDHLAEASLTAVVRPVIAEVQFFGSGSMFSAVSTLRTFVYWRLAARLGLPMYPSSRRLPSYRAITQYVDHSLREQAYSAVAEAFRTTVSEVYETEATVPIYLPPGAAVFLDTLRERRSMSDSLLLMRKRYRRLRDAFRKLQEDSAVAPTLGELHRNRRRFAAVLEELRTPDGATSAVLETSIDLLPDIVKATANPLDVTGYGETLIRTPVTWIQDWWRKRPYRLAFQLRDHLLEIANYQDLLHDATGVRISEAEIQAYAQILEDEGHYPTARRPGPVADFGANS